MTGKKMVPALALFVTATSGFFSVCQQLLPDPAGSMASFYNFLLSFSSIKRMQSQSHAVCKI
jgi:hypothetical protein